MCIRDSQEVDEFFRNQAYKLSHKKIKWTDLEQFKKKNKGKKIVFTNGCFDILHVGHVRYLEQARELGDILIVGVNSDSSVRRLKGPKRPINREQDRVELLAALDCVNHVIIFEEDTPYKLIKEIQPDILVKGGDYTASEVVGGDIVEETVSYTHLTLPTN